ncbi:HAMP domain-containing sensor histidine kinase [Paenibacillus elgii]|uniref:HAMP domain-containing sensor histidine kinase n=1 Tax=Paenibacillus elgii TaxID=189691 RepID=UPI0020410F93|nr:HAMP domain-containing sensor histidine kinase [Paenibacillus elgii]MCM3270713.1 HAMP domain-containing histidine kinase [Paenibacillus elgii]
MRRNNSIRGRRPLKKLFVRNYIVISGLLLGAIAVALVSTDILMNRVVDRTGDLPRIAGEDIYRYPFENIDGKLLDRYGGWFEVIDEAGEVIYVRGNKEDDIVRYRDGLLYAKMDMQRNDDSIYYHAYSVKGPNQEPYILLWKIPMRLDKVSAAIAIFAACFALGLLIAVYLYAKYSVKQVEKPIRQIVEGIKEMERLNYTKRLTFTAEQEFDEIREAFNGLAERLQRTSAEKEAAETSRKNMLLHLSHDLKTPMTSIYGYSQLLLDDPSLEESRRRKYIQYIHDKSSYTSNLIKDLFELAKLEDSNQILKREKVNVTKWFQQIVAECYSEIEDKGFGLDVQIPEEPLPVMLDHVHMKRVIMNLIGNALKFNAAGTVLYASCESKDGRAVLWLGDDGIGVQEPIREHIFEEFARGGGAVKDSTGLGLAICKKIVTLHQGTIELEADRRYSTMFRISLPCADA